MANPNPTATPAPEVINSVDTQGTIVRVLQAPTAAFADCAAASTAILAGKKVGCLQSIGNIEETRSTKEIKCLTSNASSKSLGAISRGSLELGLLLYPEDAEGQKELVDAFKANKALVIAVELSDSKGSNGTFYYFTGKVSAISKGFEADGPVGLTVTVEISSEISECPAK